MEIASQVGRAEGHAHRDKRACDDENQTPTYFYKNISKLTLNKLCVY